MYSRSLALGLFINVAFLAACTPDHPPQEAAPTAPARAAAETAPATEEAARPAASTAAATPTVYQLLQGKWQSTTDAKDVIEFRGHSYLDYYDKEPLGSKTFRLDTACPGEQETGNPGDDARYLVIPANDMCWHIAVVDAVSLELEADGYRVLVYTKVQ